MAAQPDPALPVRTNNCTAQQTGQAVTAACTNPSCAMHCSGTTVNCSPWHC